MSPVRVLLADDQRLVRAGFRLILENDPAIEIVAEAADGAEAVELARRHRPDVVLMDVRMPGEDGVEGTRRILADPALAGTKVVMLTTFELDEHISAAIEAGASGFLLKDIEPDDLRRAVHAVAGGQASLSPSVTARVLHQLQQRRRPTGVERLDVLTTRELDVVALVGRGLVNEEIARELYISPATVKTHVSRAMAKLHARDRAALVVLAHETGLVDG